MRLFCAKEVFSMEEITVSSEMVRNGMKICKLSMDELKKNTTVLRNSMENAYACGWQDGNREKVERIVETCISALEKPVMELEACESNLYRLLKAITEYEESLK